MLKMYIYACIRIPMEVLPGGKYEPLTNHAKIFFERCDELPTIGPLDNHNLQSVLRSLVPEPESEKEPDLEVESEQEQEQHSESDKAEPKNTTFKNRPGKIANRYSVKNRKSISLKIEGGLLSSLTSARA
jgi:hypothetical protein